MNSGDQAFLIKKATNCDITQSIKQQKIVFSNSLIVFFCVITQKVHKSWKNIVARIKNYTNFFLIYCKYWSCLARPILVVVELLSTDLMRKLAKLKKVFAHN